MLINAPLWLTLKLETVIHLFKGEIPMTDETYSDDDLTTFVSGKTLEEFLEEHPEPECSSNCEDPDCHLTHG